MNRIVTVLALVALLLAGLFTVSPAYAQGTPKKQASACAKCAAVKTGKAKTAFHRSARKTASCCTSGSCCAQCPTCCQDNSCNTGKCPKGCCSTADCQPGTACCK